MEFLLIYLLHRLMSSQKWLSQIVPPSFYAHFGPTQTRILNLTATLSPFGSTTFIDKKKRTINVAKWVVLNSVKVS